MKPQLIIIDDISGVLALKEYLKDFQLIAYDSETTGLKKSDRIVGVSVCAELDKAYYIILSSWNVTTQTLDDLGTYETTKDLIGSLQGKSLIMHNGVFDCKMAEAGFKIRLIDSLHTDTMILAHLLDENRRIGLKDLGANMYGEDETQEAKEMQASVLANGGIWTKAEKTMYKADCRILAKYGAKDAQLTLRLAYDLIPQLEEQGLYDFFYTEESMPLLKGPTYELNTTGLQIDSKALASLKKTLQAECAETKAFIYQEIATHIKDMYPGTTKKNMFNIGSSSQLSWLLFGKLGLEFGNLTKGGKAICKAMGLRLPYTFTARRDFISRCLNSVGDVYEPAVTINGKLKKAKKIKPPWGYITVDKETLKKIAPKLKWVAKLLEYQAKNKLISTYVEGIESRMQYGVLHPDYLQHGTKTGRYSSKNPNLQNLPRNDQRIKNCFVARTGKVFVSADFSQLEPRTFASYSKDPKLLKAFNGDTDFYSVVGREVYDKDDCTSQKDGSPEAFGIKYKELRDDSKVIALASAYGATPNKLASKAGKSVEDTAELMEKYFERFPGVQTMMLEAHNLVKKQGYVTNLFGRVRRIPEAKQIVKLYGKSKHWDLPYDARKLLNMACNFRIQSTGASIVNRAAIGFYEACKQAGLECKLVSQIHDELVVECSTQDAENISILLQNSMENTTLLPGVALEAIPRITNTLAK